MSRLLSGCSRTRQSLDLAGNEWLSKVWRLRLRMLLTLFAVSLSSTLRANEIPELIEALDDANIRQGASKALANLGEKAVPALQESLASDNPDVQVWSAFTLGEIGPTAKQSAGDLIKALSNSDAAVRAAAAQALGKITTSSAIEPLAKSLNDDNEVVRRRTAVAVGRFGPAAKLAAGNLIERLADPLVRTLARDALIEIGPTTTDILRQSLGNDLIRFDIQFVLSKFNSNAAKPSAADLTSLRMALFDPTRDHTDHTLAAVSLASLGSDGVEVLVQALEEPKLARTAATAFKSAGPDAVPRLVEVLSHETPAVRGTAADALGHIGPAGNAAAPKLVELLKDQDRDVRYRAVRALHTFGQHAKPAVATLAKVLVDAREQELTRQWAIKTLAVTLPDTHDEVVKALIAGSQEEQNYGVRQLARQFLKQIDPEAAKAAGVR